jgi:tRNA (guanine-N7-)-methyltransferase
VGTHGSRDAAEEPARLTAAGKRRSELHGRRKGRPLSALQQSLFDGMLPAVGLPAGDIEPGALFPGATSFALEVGFGGGEHLAAQAKLNPHLGFIGCEPFENGVAKLLGQVRAHGLSNVRVHPDDARDILGRLPDQCLSVIFVLFPDPWPKARHHKRRFIQPATLDQIARVLKPGGELRVATDHPDYAQWALMHLIRDERFAWSAKSAADWRVRPPDWVITRYEQKALAAGRACVYLRFFRN